MPGCFDGSLKIEECHGVMKGWYPLNEGQLSGRYYWKFREWYTGNWFTSLNLLYSERKHKCPVPTASDELARSSDGAGSDDENEPPRKKARTITLLVLPDNVMVKIFGNLHPVEVAHTVSLVSRKWHRLSQAPALWREIRVVPCNAPTCYASLRTFLHRQRRSVVKLCIDFWPDSPESVPDASIIDAFPGCMPSVSTLDIGCLPCPSIGFARFLITCFPNVERLNLERVYQAEKGALKIILAEGFPRLKDLILHESHAVTAQDIAALCEAHSLKILHIGRLYKLQHYACQCLSNSAMTTTLTRLYMDRDDRVDDNSYRLLTRCQNLEVLSVANCRNSTDMALGHIKLIPKLQHLHLQLGDWFTEAALKVFFEADPRNNTALLSFPMRLKYLDLLGCSEVNDDVVDLVTKNCPNLISLSLALCSSVTEIGLTKVAQRLLDLQFLDITELREVSGRILLDVPSLHLKRLRYLCAVGSGVSSVVLQTLNLQKKNLIICIGDADILVYEAVDGIARFSKRRGKNIESAVRDRLAGYNGFCCMTAAYVKL